MACGASPLPAQTTTERLPEVTWHELEQSLESGRPFDVKAYIGKRVLFDASVIDGFTDKVNWLRPNPLWTRIYRFDRAQGTVIETGIECCVTLLRHEIKPVAGHVAASIDIRVLGRITGINSVDKTVKVQSVVTKVTDAE